MRIKIRLLIFFAAIIFTAQGIVVFHKSNVRIFKPRSRESTLREPLLAANVVARVSRVVDGDTIKILTSYGEDTIRLIGIDSPETLDPRKPVQCFGNEATREMIKLVWGKNIQLEADSTQGERDKYGRLLRFIFLEDGTPINKTMIERGYAFEYTYAAPYKYRDEYIAAEEYARTNQLGLWNPSVCVIKNIRSREETEYIVH